MTDTVKCRCGHRREFRFSDQVPLAIKDRVMGRAERLSCPACDSDLADSMGIRPSWAVIEDGVCRVIPQPALFATQGGAACDPSPSPSPSKPPNRHRMTERAPRP